MNRLRSVRRAVLGSSALMLLAAGAQAQPVEEVVVTGTLIRGVAPVGSSLISVGAQDLQKSGVSSTSDLMLRIPQVVNLGYSDTTQAGGSRQQGAQGNNTFTRSINLRGLGSTGTLTMFNGQRIVAGTLQNTTDMDSYPAGLVQRIEVVADGGSATYGSDAVAGTVNVILRDPEDVVETIGQAVVKDHGTDWLVEQVLGTTWDAESTGIGAGGIILSYQHSVSEAARETDYPHIYNDDLTPYIGAAGALSTFASPGNATGLAGAGGATALYAVPTGIARTQRLLLSQLGTVNQPNRMSLWTNTFVIPQIKRDTVAGNFRQELTDWLTFRANGFYFNRAGFGVFGTTTSDQITISVPATNPYTPCAPGVSAANTQGIACPANNTIQTRYSFARELGGARRNFHQQSYGGTYGFDVDLPYEWQARINGHWSKNFDDAPVSPRVNTTALAQVVTGTGKPANVPFFNPFCDNTVAPCNDPITLAYITGNSNWNTNLNWYEDYNIAVDGPLFDLPGGQVRLAVGGDLGRYGFDTKSYSTLTAAIGQKIQSAGVNPHRTVKAAFAEVYIPVIGDANAMPGVEKLEVTLAGRVTDYSDSGSTQDPKIGVNWKPIQEVTVHGSWGTSFRAPTMRENNPNAARALRTSNALTCGQFTGINLAACATGATTPISSYIPIGGRNGIVPETAETWSLGVDWQPSVVPGLTASLTYYDIVHEQRIFQPGSDADFVGSVNAGFYDSIIAFNPTFWGARAVVTAPVAEFVPGAVVGTPMTQAQFNAYAAAIVAGFAGTAAGNPLSHITDGRMYNAGTLDTNGFDFTAYYDTDIDWGSLHFGITGNYVTSFKTQIIAGAPLTERVNTFGNQPRFRTRLEAGISNDDGWSATAYVNYLNSYKALVTDIPAGAPLSYTEIDAFTTVDLSLGYDFGEENSLPLINGIRLQAVATNLFDSDPPFFLNGAGTPAILFDPQNANPYGRYYTLRLTKKW